MVQIVGTPLIQIYYCNKQELANFLPHQLTFLNWINNPKLLRIYIEKVIRFLMVVDLCLLNFLEQFVRQ